MQRSQIRRASKNKQTQALEIDDNVRTTYSVVRRVATEIFSIYFSRKSRVREAKIPSQMLQRYQRIENQLESIFDIR